MKNLFHQIGTREALDAFSAKQSGKHDTDAIRDPQIRIKQGLAENHILFRTQKKFWIDRRDPVKPRLFQESLYAGKNTFSCQNIYRNTQDIHIFHSNGNVSICS
jgi:hypothetical protein